VILAIDFNDKPRRRCNKINDGEPHDDLPLNGDPKLLRIQARPQQSLERMATTRICAAWAGRI
jgi:hypothetical protein